MTIKHIKCPSKHIRRGHISPIRLLKALKKELKPLKGLSMIRNPIATRNVSLFPG
jgi:hypothetical protein